MSNIQNSELITIDRFIQQIPVTLTPLRSGQTDTDKRFSQRINVIRSVAICSVIWGHCLSGLEHKVFTSLPERYIQSALMQIGRIGTVLFFIITGYLLDNKIRDLNILSYLRYRFKPIILPWLLFLTLVVFIQVFQNLSFSQILAVNKTRLFILMISLYKSSVFHAAYWFIPVTIMSSSLLIACKRYMQHEWFGILLCCFTIFYCINLFYGWIPSNHTQAFLGYALFLWIGSQIKAHSCQIDSILRSISWKTLIPLLLFSFILTCREGMLLKFLHSDDPYASNRISNILFSIILFFSLIKSYRLAWVRRFKPRENTYGIYLVHTIFIMILTPSFINFINKYNLDNHIIDVIFMRLILFSIILTISYLVVTLIIWSPLRFIIGKKNNV